MGIGTCSTAVLAGIGLALTVAQAAVGQAVVTTRARGTFEVKLTPQAPGAAPDSTLGRLAIDKRFHGDLEGISRGEMLTAMTPVEGSAGYVAIERVTGKLHGRSGSFVLQHSGTMTRGAPELAVTVVPDSGTEELAGLTGRMAITIAGGKHSYELEYTLPPGSSGPRRHERSNP